MSLTKVTYSMISGAPINVLDYGADPSGVADSTQAIQAAIDAAQALTNSPTISIPAGEYKITDTLTITRSNISIVGESSPSRGPGSDSTGTTRGSTLRYSGTGTAVLIGVAPDVNGTFIDGIIFANLRIEVDNTTQCALRVWTSSNGLFSNIAIFGKDRKSTRLNSSHT